MRHSVLVCCASTWSSPARLPRILKEAGLEVSVFSAPGQMLTLSRFIDKLVTAPAALDDYVDALRDHLATTAYDWVVLTDDPLLDEVRRRHAEPWVEKILPISNASDWVGALSSKADFTRLAQAADLPIPESRLCTTLAEAQKAASELGLPIMLKKATSYAGMGVAKVEDLAELPEIWSQLEGGTVVAQKFIPGKLGSSCGLLHRGKPLAWASSEKVRTWPGTFGPSTARRIYAHPDIEKAFERFGAATQYHGFAAFDWIVDADNNFRIIEMNARPTNVTRLGALAGTNWELAIQSMLNGGEAVYPPAAQPVDTRVVALFPEDIMRAITRDGFSRDVVASWIPRRGRYNDIPWRDPKVLAGYVQMSIINLRARRQLRKSAAT